MESFVNKKGRRDIYSPWRTESEREISFSFDHILRTFFNKWPWILGTMLGGFILGWFIFPFLPLSYSSSATILPPGNEHLHDYFVLTQDLEDVSKAEDLFDQFLLELNSMDARREFWRGTQIYKNRISLYNLPEGGVGAKRVLDDLSRSLILEPRETEEAKASIIDLSLSIRSQENVSRLLSDQITFTNERVIKKLKNQLSLKISEKILQIEREEEKGRKELEFKIKQKEKKLKDALEMAISLGIKDGSFVVKEPELIEKGPLYVRGEQWLREEIRSLPEQLKDEAYVEGHSDRMASISVLKGLDPEQIDIQLYQYSNEPSLGQRAAIVGQWGSSAIIGISAFILCWFTLGLRSKYQRN